MAVYLDNNATTAMDEAVLEAMLPYMGQVTGNPSSVHRFGRMQKHAIEQARELVAQLVGARAEQVIFTSGGTESNNLLLNGFSCLGTDPGTESCNTGRIAVSAVEHMSLLEPAQQHAAQHAANLDLIPVDENGLISVASLEKCVNDDTSLVSVMSANNETGVIQNLAPLVEYAAQRNCYFHTDASQAAGKIALDFNTSAVHAMTLSAHKLYGPIGVGALVINKQLPVRKLQFGGRQEKNLRAGTENVPAIVGFGKAAELALSNLHDTAKHLLSLRQALEKGLKEFSTISVFAQQAQRLPNTVQFGIDGFDGETMLMQLDRKAIAVSSGSACTSGKTEPSHVLTAMGVPDALAHSAIRVSFGKNNTMSDVDALLTALNDIIKVNQQSPVMMAATV